MLKSDIKSCPSATDIFFQARCAPVSNQPLCLQPITMTLHNSITAVFTLRSELFYAKTFFASGLRYVKPVSRFVNPSYDTSDALSKDIFETCPRHVQGRGKYV